MHSKTQGYRYLIVQIKNNGLCDGRIVEVVLPNKKISINQASNSALIGTQSIVNGDFPTQLGLFTGCIFIYSPTYIYQTGILYQNGVAQQKRIRLRVERGGVSDVSENNVATKSTIRNIIEDTTVTTNLLLEVCETITVVVTSDGKVIGGYTTVNCTTLPHYF